MNELKKYVEVYNYFLEQTSSQEVAIKLVKEWGLDQRTEAINLSKKEIIKEQQTQKANEPASEKQLNTIKSLQKQGKIQERDLAGLTKLEASEIISEVLGKKPYSFQIV